MKILIDYKYNNKSVCYKFFDNNRVFIVSKEDLFNKMHAGNLKVENAYIMGNSIAIKGGVPRVKLKNCCPIPISMIDLDTEPFKIDSIFGANVTPDMLDAKALSLIEKIDNAKAEKDVYKYGKFSTDFGVCDLYSLSSGCKAVLLGYLNQRDNINICLDLTSAGLNAIAVLLDYLSTCKSISIVLGFRCLPTFYNNDFGESYLFRDTSDNMVKTFLDFFMSHPFKEV